MSSATPPAPRDSALIDPEFGLAPQRPAEVVELSELLYRRIFASGMIVAAATAAYAVLLSALQPPGYRVAGVIAGLLLLACCSAAFAARAASYAMLRRRPWLIAIPAMIVGGAAWTAGTHNAQFFYVITLVLGVTGLAVPFRVLFAATLVAAIGCAMPRVLAESGWITSTAVAALTVPTVFWLIIEQLGRYILRIHELTGGQPAPPSAPPRRESAAAAPASETPAELRRAPWRRLLQRGGSRTLAPAAGALPAAATAQPRLSARQLQVLLLCAEGLQHGEVAAALQIHPQQVRRHLRAARERTGSSTTAALIAWAVQGGLLPGASRS